MMTANAAMIPASRALILRCFSMHTSRTHRAAGHHRSDRPANPFSTAWGREVKNRTARIVGTKLRVASGTRMRQEHEPVNNPTGDTRHNAGDGQSAVFAMRPDLLVAGCFDLRGVCCTMPANLLSRINVMRLSIFEALEEAVRTEPQHVGIATLYRLHPSSCRSVRVRRGVVRLGLRPCRRLLRSWFCRSWLLLRLSSS